MSTGRGSESFLGRWSARKRGADEAARRRDDAAAEVEASDANAPRAPDAGAASCASESTPRVDVADASTHPAPEERAVFGTGIPGIDAGSALVAGADARSTVDSSTMDDAPATLDADEPAEPPPLTDADMPPIESLHAGSDLSGFFSKGVSAALRRAALRHVFAQPAYNVRDGLNDYDGDYTVFEPLGDTVTSDMKFHAARRERERLEREERERLARAEPESADESVATGDPDARSVADGEDTVVDEPADAGTDDEVDVPSGADDEVDAQADGSADGSGSGEGVHVSAETPEDSDVPAHG